MNKSKAILGALSLSAALLCAPNAEAQYTPSLNFYTAGSSAQFNTFGVAASYTIPPAGAPLCGTHHWSQKSSSSLPITIFDPRSSSIIAEPANIWIAWDDNAANHVANAGIVCFYATVDSIVGVRAYQAHATLQLAGGLSGHVSASPELVPLIGAGEALPASIYSIVNGAAINAANTDIRPEDAKFATMRVMTTVGTQMTGRAVTGQGYGPGPIGTGIKSSQSTAIAYPVDFAIDPGDIDPINSSNAVRPYADVSIGAAPVMVIVNASNANPGHFGDGNFTNINRFMLAKALEGQITHTRDLAYTPNLPDVPLHVFLREPLSGTYNTMEFTIPMSREIDGDNFTPGQVGGQDNGVVPSNTSCTTTPCTVESGNPLWHIAGNGTTRGRVVGSGEMISTVNGTADSIGYSFWGFSSFQGKTNLKYLLVDGVDPLYSGPSANPSGANVLPSCTLTNGYATSCPQVPFTNIVNGSYPIWSKYRMMWDPATSNTNVATAIVSYAQKASDPTNGIITDMVPAGSMRTFRSHYTQVVRDSGIAYTGNNGFKSGIPETGGDMGGAVLTIQSELDFINDTGGQQINQQQ